MSAIGTLYDIKRLDTNQQQPVKSKILMAFSIRQNYRRLILPPTTRLAEELTHAQAIRFLTILIILIGHVEMATTINPANPEFIEAKFHNFFSHFILSASIYVQTFFILSGHLLSVQFIDELKNKRKYSFTYFWIAVIGRYVRLTPVYAFLLLFDATLLYKLNMGPFWKPIAEHEKYICRKNWWLNLLYMNNYFEVKNGCMLHTWYLAADTQLFVVGMLVMMLIWKYPKCTYWILGSILTVTIMIPGIVTYIFGFDGIYTLPPEYVKLFLCAFHQFNFTY